MSGAKGRRPRRARTVPKRLHEDVDDGDLAKVRDREREKKARGLIAQRARTGARFEVSSLSSLYSRDTEEGTVQSRRPTLSSAGEALYGTVTDYSVHTPLARPRARAPPPFLTRVLTFWAQALAKPRMPKHRVFFLASNADPPSFPGARKLLETAAAGSARRSRGPCLSPLRGRVPKPTRIHITHATPSRAVWNMQDRASGR